MRLRDFLTDNHTTPEGVRVHLTAQCNGGCLYCEIGQKTAAEEFEPLTLRDMEWLLDQMETHRISNLMLGGGEPFLSPHIWAVLEKARRMHLKITILSNGTLLSGFDSKQWELLRSLNLKLSISCDSYDKKIQANARGMQDGMKLVWDGIQALLRQRIDFNLVTVISRYNAESLAELVNRASESGVRDFLFQPAIVVDSNFPDREKIADKIKVSVTAQQLPFLDEQLKQILTLERKYQIKTNVRHLRPWIFSYLRETECINDKPAHSLFFKQFVNELHCSFLAKNIMITYSGELLACNLIRSGISIKSEKDIGLTELWKKARQPVRAQFKKKQYPRACDFCICDSRANHVFSFIRNPLKNMKALKSLLCIPENPVFDRLRK